MGEKEKTNEKQQTKPQSHSKYLFYIKGCLFIYLTTHSSYMAHWRNVLNNNMEIRRLLHIYVCVCVCVCARVCVLYHRTVPD